MRAGAGVLLHAPARRAQGALAPAGRRDGRGLNHVWLFLAGIAASVFNAAAGGGTLISFPALLAVGLAPLQANATSSVALQAGLITALWSYRDRLREMRGDVGRLLPPCVTGGAFGAVLALALGARVFAAIAPALLAIGALLILLQPLITRVIAVRQAQERPTVFFIGAFVLAVYCGYFGAGGGILFLAALALLLPRPFDELNALKVLALPASNGIAAVTFVVLELSHPTGVVVWRSVPMLALGALIGGALGVSLAKRLPARALRIISGALGLAMAAWIVLK
ncbi:MAG: sulfite exporter TauE/SafE family protein [Myxococcales bacterium]|nr:sulfite exporter TauE/SafE family protein [Myxococcales bacterium]